MTKALPTVLEAIVDKRRTHLPGIAKRISHVDPETLPRSTRSLEQSLRGRANFIMECKSASPSLGMIREHYQPGDIARVYSRYAAGISVLCEPERFRGDYDHLATVAASTHLPVLCKDFIVDPVQIHAARYFGADAVLLMLSVLDDATYAALANEAERLGLDVLTEVIDEEEVERATKLGARIYGINHRNLHDLSIDLDRSARLARLVPESAIVVSESGIQDVETVRRLGGHSNAFLVGSQLTSQPDIDLAARELLYGPNKVCGLTAPSSAQAARAMGAVYGGLIFEESSPRNVSRETARNIMAAEPNLSYVAVTRQVSGFASLIDALGEGIEAIQLHAPYQGSLEQELALIDAARATGKKVWRAVNMSEPHGPELAQALSEHVDILVLDAGEGGTGVPFDWATVSPEVRHKALLAGGIGAENVTQALEIGCHGLDINSRAEHRGRKDPAMLRAIFEKIRFFHYASSNGRK